MLQSEISSNGLGIILHARFKRLRKQSNIRRNKDNVKYTLWRINQNRSNVKLHGPKKVYSPMKQKVNSKLLGHNRLFDKKNVCPKKLYVQKIDTPDQKKFD